MSFLSPETVNHQNLATKIKAKVGNTEYDFQNAFFSFLFPILTHSSEVGVHQSHKFDRQ